MTIDITDRAAATIAEACDLQEIAESGGLRIAPKTTVNDGSVRSLVVEFVDRPASSDTIIRAGAASVFLADGVERLVGARTLDTERVGTPPKFVLRARTPPPPD